MKRKSWIYVLSSLCILIGTFCLSGCGNSEQEEPVAENTIITRQTVQEEKAKKDQAVNKEGTQPETVSRTENAQESIPKVQWVTEPERCIIHILSLTMILAPIENLLTIIM